MAAAPYAQLAFEAGSAFTPGSPINEKDLFAGRIPQVRKILETISQRGYHAVLYGERGVGKTSLSNVLADFLREAGKTYLLPRVNCDASDTFSTLWKKALQDIVITKAKPGMGFHANEIEETNNIVESLPEEVTPDDVRRVLSELGAGTILVVIFDEFDRLKDPKITTLMADTIKALSDYSVPATILLIGVADSVQGLIGDHQSIERALSQIQMQRMSEGEIEQIVRNGLARLTMEIKPDALEEIVSLSQGLPYITHLLSLHTARRTLGEQAQTITLANVQAGIAEALEQWQQSTKTAYYLATKSQQPDTIYRAVLLACALAENDDLGYFTAAAVRKPLRIITDKLYDIPNFARHLKQLSGEERGNMLQRVGETRRLRYRFVSPIMRPYIVMRGFRERLLDKKKLAQIKASSG